jgi:hypothetical protein
VGAAGGKVGVSYMALMKRNKRLRMPSEAFDGLELCATLFGTTS